VSAPPGTIDVTVNVSPSATLNVVGVPIIVSSQSSVSNSGAVIASAPAYGIVAAGNNNQIVNQTSGSIVLANDPGANGGAAGVLLAGSNNSAVNAGSIMTSNSAFVGVEVISGGGTTGGGNTIINSGTIVAGGANGSAIFIVTPPAFGTNTIINAATGVLQSASGIAIVGLGNESLVNYGQIDGSVNLGTGANTATLYRGSSITGDLLLGSDPRATLVLAGTGNEALSSAVSGTVQATDLIKEGASAWTIDKPISGNTSATITSGELLVNTILSQSAVLVQSTGQLAGLGTIASLNNLGSVMPGSAPTAFNSLTVLGNYSGSGRLIFNTVLQGTGGQSNQLVIDGSTTGARSQVVVINLGGRGGLTVGNGIPLIDVGGSSDPQAFHMVPLQVGPYVYMLDQGGLDASAGNGSWYLRSVAGAVFRNANGMFVIDPTVTSEATAHLADQAFARSAFRLSLYDRLGNQQPPSSEDAGDGRLFGPWMRLDASRLSWGQPASAATTDASNYLAQFGSDLQTWELDQGASIRLGAMASYAEFSGDGTSRYGTQNAQVAANGLAAGLYATWFENARLDRGWYIDAWSLLGGINDRVTSSAERVNSSQAESQSSIELGYTMPFAAGVLVTPQLQLIANDLMRRTLNDSSAMALSEGGTSWTGRLGFRIAGPGTNADQAYAPFLGVNFWHDSNAAAIVENGSETSVTLPRERYELMAGLEWRVSNIAALSTSVKLERGAQSYKSTEGQLVFKVAL